LTRGLDHIVHAVHDLDAAVEFYRRLGFQVGARNRHPRAWGTQNQIVQLRGTFIELLSVADESGIVPHATRHFSFGAFNRDFLAHKRGLSMLVLAGRGAADADDFRSMGIGDFEPYEFEREGKRPDGTAIKVAFALAFAADPKAPATGFFTCLHRHPEYFWNPAFQVHANTATAVTGVVLVAARPSEHESFLAAFTGAGMCKAMPGGIAIQTERGNIQVVTPTAFSDLHGVAPPDVSGGARLAALRFSVRDKGTVKSIFEQAKIPVTMAGNSIVAGPQAAMGAVLVFDR
jgi:catechol 2,3-dioxygenase-like lactoylglutathione lyase family enzyme